MKRCDNCLLKSGEKIKLLCENKLSLLTIIKSDIPYVFSETDFITDTTIAAYAASTTNTFIHIDVLLLFSQIVFVCIINNIHRHSSMVI